MVLLLNLMVMPVPDSWCPIFNISCNHFVLKSFSFQLLLRFICSDLRLYFVSVLQIISVSLSVSLNNIMLVSVSVSVNEYITADRHPAAVSQCIKIG